MSIPATDPCDTLTWDTEFFQCRIGRVRGDTLTQEQAARIDGWSRDNRIECLYFLARADDPATISNAEANGFGLVDIRVSFERKVVGSQGMAVAEQSLPATIRGFRGDDLAALQGLARMVHTRTRFFTDPRFPRAMAEALYSTWITIECEGRAQKVFVAASAADQPLGYVSCRFDPARKAGEIGLLGVHTEARGRSLAKNLILTALDWFRAQGSEVVTVVTQGTNVPAQRLYQRHGFLLRDLQLWYHKWYATPAGSDV